jgi:hypothetical protein
MKFCSFIAFFAIFFKEEGRRHPIQVGTCQAIYFHTPNYRVLKT